MNARKAKALRRRIYGTSNPKKTEKYGRNVKREKKTLPGKGEVLVETFGGRVASPQRRAYQAEKDREK